MIGSVSSVIKTNLLTTIEKLRNEEYFKSARIEAGNVGKTLGREKRGNDRGVARARTSERVSE